MAHSCPWTFGPGFQHQCIVWLLLSREQATAGSEAAISRAPESDCRKQGSCAGLEICASSWRQPAFQLLTYLCWRLAAPAQQHLAYHAPAIDDDQFGGFGHAVAEPQAAAAQDR